MTTSTEFFGNTVGHPPTISRRMTAASTRPALSDLDATVLRLLLAAGLAFGLIATIV